MTAHYTNVYSEDIVQWPNVGYYSRVLVLTGKAGPYVDVSMTF